jgi:hypothetical protein
MIIMEYLKRLTSARQCEPMDYGTRKQINQIFYSITKSGSGKCTPELTMTSVKPITETRKMKRQARKSTNEQKNERIAILRTGLRRA